MTGRQSLLRNSVRGFASKTHENHEKPGKASGRKTGNPGWYNKRFEPSKSLDGNYFDY